MRKKLFKNLTLAGMAALVFTMVFSLALPAMATLDPWAGREAQFQTQTGLGNRDVRDIIGAVINILLGFLGIIAVVLILLGGFKWMTAAGNEDKVAEAKKLMAAGVIGVVIILAAFALSQFVLRSLINATGAV